MAKAEVANKVAAAILCPEDQVQQPARARSSSFASVVADLKVGDHPAAKAIALNPTVTIEQTKALMPELSERLRNTVQSSVKQAKKRLGGTAEFSVEIVEVNTKSGLLLTAYVTRNA
jgi:hypothetical protein